MRCKFTQYASMLLLTLIILSFSACPVFRATGQSVEAVGEGGGHAIAETGRGIGHAVAGTGEAISDAAN